MAGSSGRADWVGQLQAGTIPPDIDPLEELRILAEHLDPGDTIAIFANIDVPEIDEPPTATD
jgi:hypothetical protein